MTGGDRQRGVTPIVGNLLLVAVVIVIAVALVTLSFTFLEGFGTPTADAQFEYEETPAGLQMTPAALGTDAIVRLNGERIDTVEADAAGQSVLLPTAPGDRITVVSQDAERSVLIDRTVDDRSEIGDFIAYYTFDQGSGTTVVDRSGNDNDGTASASGTTRGSDEGGTYMQFDGASGTHVDMGDLTVDGPVEVDEITIAVRYSVEGGDGDIQNVIEHQPSQGDSFAWYFETDGPHGNPSYDMEYNIGFTSPRSASVNTGTLPDEQTELLIGTYDGDTMTLYRNGTEVGSKALDRPVELGQVIVGADSNPSIQNFDGHIHEVRLYYTAFSEDEVKVLSEAMDDGVE